VFAIPGALAGDQRRKKIAAEFRIHVQQSHQLESPGNKRDLRPQSDLTTDRN
jgi:hypothetical protein